MMAIAVDTGNRCIKVPDISPFTAGLFCSGTVPPTASSDTIYYNKKFYSLSEERGEYLRDKTTSEKYFILTLFAIAKRILAKQPGQDAYEKEVILALGLPPSHCTQSMKMKYKKYFSNGGQPIEFTYNDVYFRIHIAYPENPENHPEDLKDPTKCGVYVFTQGHAAAMLRIKEILEYPQSYVVDIGGYTTDIIRLNREKGPSGGYRMKTDASQCESLNMGVIHLFNEIKRRVSESVGDGLSETIIDAIMQGQYKLPDDEVMKIISEESVQYAKKIIDTLADKGISLRFAHPVFIGGGASVLHNQLVDACPNGEKATFIPQLTANAEGYAQLLNAMLVKKGLIGKPAAQNE